MCIRDRCSTASTSSGRPSPAWSRSPRSSTCRWSPPTTCTTPPRLTRWLTRCCCACRPAPPSPTRPDFGSRRTSSTSSPRRRCASSSATIPRPATTPWRSPSGSSSPCRPASDYCRTSRFRPARPSSPGCAGRSSAGCTAATAPTRPASSGRRSAAGCTVSYCLGITELDPLRYGLIFERFLNPERVSMPDIDMDFDERRRGDMIRYATERYGDDRVAQIVTFGTIKAKQAIKDSARVLGFPYAVGDRLTKLLPQPVMGRDVCLADCFDPTAPRYGEAGELRAALDVDPDVRRVLETARGLEGLKRQAGVHAAGVVICRDPLTDHIPVWRREADGAVITQFDMGTCEQLGLLKMDFLGLRNLTVLDDCLA